jgi:Domain of unknown function (DUF5134)
LSAFLDARPVADLFAVMMAAVAFHGGARMVVPALRGAGHPRDVGAWHGLMGACMAVMLAASLPGRSSGAALAVFAVGVLWCVVQIARRTSGGAYLRLGVCCVAMLAMLVPAVVAGATGETMAGATGMTIAGMAGMPAMPATSLPPLLGVVLIVALAGVVVSGTTRIAGRERMVAYRVDAGCEIVTATAMAYMLVVML